MMDLHIVVPFICFLPLDLFACSLVVLRGCWKWEYRKRVRSVCAEAGMSQAVEVVVESSGFVQRQEMFVGCC